MNIHKVLGPPGTGKTTFLITEIEGLLKTFPNANVGFFSFTTKATFEAKYRMVTQLGLDPRDPSLFYFRTLHSLAYNLMNLNRDSLMGDRQFEEFGQEYGYDINIKTAYDGYYTYVTPDDELYKEYQLATALGQPMPDEELAKFAHDLNKFKESRMLVDFTDMLVLASDHVAIPKFDLLCIDEAQDLSPIQWRLAHRLIESASNVIVTGDDDQAIYAFAGADVNHFINLEAHNTVLHQSYRLSEDVVNYARNFAEKNITRRINKEYHGLPTKTGQVQHIYDAMECDLSKGSWLILCRHIWDTRKFMELCESQDISYSSKTLPKSEQNDEAPVQIQTIHSVKGGEADNVLLTADISRRVYDSMEVQVNFENECRVFYVGMTRSRGDLYVLQPQTNMGMEL